MNGISPDPVEISLTVTRREQAVGVSTGMIGLVFGALLAHPNVPLWVVPLLILALLLAGAFSYLRVVGIWQSPDQEPEQAVEEVDASD